MTGEGGGTGITRRGALGAAAATGATLAAGAAGARATGVLLGPALPAQRARGVEHVVVYRDEKAFCAWPFYCGLWKTADGSLLAGFKRVPNNYGGADEVSHLTVTNQPGEIVVVRSRDNGASWDRASLLPVFDMAIRAEKDFPGGKAADWSSLPPLDFRSRDTLLMGGGLPAFMGPEKAWIRASTDGGRTWRPHSLLPNWGFPAISIPGSSMYSVRADGTMLLGVQAWAPGMESPLPVVYANPDGRDFLYLGSMVEERPKSAFWPTGAFASAQTIYPRVIVLADGRVLASVRYQRDPRNVLWVEIHESLDGGRTWRWLSRVNDWGAPGDLVPMADGRVVCVYGYRLPSGPGIRYRVSEDQGRSWGPEMILRDDAGSWDLGYPRVIEIAPGTLLATYYINLKGERVNLNGGVRHIQCSIFRP